MPQIAVDANGNKVRWDEKKKLWVPVEKASDASGNILEFDGAKWNPVSVGMKPVAGEQKTAGQSAKEKITEQISGGKFQIPFTAPDLGTEPIWTSPVFKKDYWGQVGTGSYWSETYRNLKRAATDMEPMGAYAKTMGKTLAMKLTRKQWDKKYGDKAREEYARQVDPDTAEKIWPSTGEVVGGAFKGLGKGAVDFALWMPRTAYNLVRDPLTTIHDDPLGAIFLLSGVSGGAKTLWKKHKSGKPILPSELKALEPELKKWALENKDNVQKYQEIVEAAQKRADLAKDMSVQKEQMGPEIPGAFPETRRKTGLSPRSVRGPEIPEEAANIAARQQPVPVGPVTPGPMKVAPAQEFGGDGFNRIMAGPEVVSGPGVEWGGAEKPPTMPTPPNPTTPVSKIKTEVPVKPEAPAAKEPWQMTKAEFINKRGANAPMESDEFALHHLSSVGDGKPGLSVEGDKIIVRNEAGSPIGVTTIKTIGGQKVTDSTAVHPGNRRQGVATQLYAKAKELGYDTGYVENVASAGAKHKLAVKQALAEGQPVPPEVLKEYPDLAKATKSAVIKTSPIVEEMIGTVNKSVSELRGKVSDVRYGKPGEIVFEFDGKTMVSKEPKDVLPVGQGEASKAWALKQVLDKKAKPLDLTSSQMKMGLDEFDNLKKAYAGFPILDENLQKYIKYIKSGRLIVGPAQDAKTGAKVPVPAKIVGMGDFKTDIPRYTSTPRDKSVVEPFKIEKTAGGMPGGMPGYKHELESLLKQKDMPATAVKHEYENPVRWFDSSPFLKESLYYPWREADHGHMLEKIGYRAVIDSWKRNITGTNWRRAERDLGAYAIAKQKNGPETLQLMGIDPADVVSRVEANPSMMKVYGEARGYLETMFTRINKAREILGMPPLPKVENYFTFARGVTDLSAMGVNPVTISDPAMIKRHLYEPTFQYKSRENVIGPMSTKFFGIFEHYINSASKYTLYAPVVAKGRMMLGDWAINDSVGRPAGNFNLRDTAPNLSNMVSEWVDRIAGKKLTTNKAFSKALGALARNTGTSVIAFNPRSTLIQPTSLANTYIEVGAKNLLKGMEEYALKENRQLAMRESMVLKGRAMDFHLEDLWADGVAGAINKGRSKASAVGTYPLRALDAMSAQVSWLSAVEKGKQLGLEGRELYRYADDIVVRTQASAKIGDVARIQTTPLGKLATIFQTFVINNWNYWSKDVFGWKNPEMATADRVRKVSRLILSSVIINSLFEDVLGINSPLPAPEREIVEGIRRGDTPGQIGVNVAKEVGESVPFFGGAIKYTSDKYQSYPPVVQQGVDVAKLWSSVQKAINKKDIKAFTIKDWETASKILGIPGGGVAANMYKKAQAGMPWWKIVVGAPSQKQESSYPRYLQR